MTGEGRVTLDLTQLEDANFSLGLLTRVAAKAIKDHARGRESVYTLNDVVFKVFQDVWQEQLDYDRCSHALHSGERFALPGEGQPGEGQPGWWIIADAEGKWNQGCPWRLVHTVSRQLLETVSQRTLATLLPPHPNPYVASIEVEYASSGARALYGLRKDGKLVLWAD